MGAQHVLPYASVMQDFLTLHEKTAELHSEIQKEEMEAR
jgi:hypothetical protein